MEPRGFTPLHLRKKMAYRCQGEIDENSGQTEAALFRDAFTRRLVSCLEIFVVAHVRRCLISS
jgi:hypothetical protein